MSCLEIQNPTKQKKKKKLKKTGKYPTPMYAVTYKPNITPRRRFFPITAEIHARPLAKFYGQYGDRHMNLKFVRRVSEREQEIRQSVIVKNKFVLLLTMNFVITLLK